jgi:hypothetical protein
MATSAREPKTWLLNSPQYTLEQVAADATLFPIRLYQVLFPLREVEVSGTVREDQPYDLVAEFLMRGIAEGGLATTESLVTFFGLEQSLVEKMLAFLQTFGQLQQVNGSWMLTPLGVESCRDQKLYTPKQTRRKLYFEPFTSHPLPKEYYRLEFLSPIEASEAKEREGYYQRLADVFFPWSPVVLCDLAQRPDREKYNLPYQIDAIQEENLTTVYLPMQVIETRKMNQQGAIAGERYYAVVTRLARTRDGFFEWVVNKEPDFASLLEAEAQADQEPDPMVRAALEERLARRKLDARVRKVAPDIWRVLPERQALLAPKGEMNLNNVGRFLLLGKGVCAQIWCDDPQLRSQAVLEQTLDLLQRKQHRGDPLSRQAVNDLMRTLALRLDVKPPGWNALSQRAQERNLKSFLDQVIHS